MRRELVEGFWRDAPLAPVVRDAEPQELAIPGIYRPMLKLGVVVALLMSIGSAAAASFNCTAATTPLERLICNTPSLSADDDQLAQVYTAALSAVSEKSRDALRAGQRSWLRYLAAIMRRQYRDQRRPVGRHHVVVGRRDRGR